MRGVRVVAGVAALVLAAGCGSGRTGGEDPAPPAEKAPQPVKGLERVEAQSGRSSDSSREAVASCPAGKKVLGGGGRVVGGGREVRMSALRPEPDGSGYRIRADEDADGYAGAWALQAYAMCAQAPSGLEYLSAKANDLVGAADRLPLGLLVGDRRKGATVECPAGKHLTGGGVEVPDAPGNAVVSFTGGVDGEDSPAEVTARGFLRGGGTEHPVVVAHAVCVDPLETYNRDWNHDVNAQGPEQESKLACYKDTRMLGLSVYAVQTSQTTFGANLFDGLTLVGAVPDEKLGRAVLSAALHPGFKEYDDIVWVVGGAAYCAKVIP